MKKRLVLLLLLSLCLCRFAAADFILPADLVTVEDEAFLGVQMGNIVIPEGVEEIGEYAFANTGRGYTCLPASLRSIAYTAFVNTARQFLVHSGSAAEAWCQDKAYEYELIEDMSEAFSLDRESAGVRPGGTLQLTLTCSELESAFGAVWTSSDPAVAEVDENGLVTAVSLGTADITVTCPGTGRSAVCALKVRQPVYRALLVGEVNYESGEVVRWNRMDVAYMSGILTNHKTPDGTDWEITRRYDLGRDALKEAIRTVFADTEEGDVSLFHISSHGETYGTGIDAGRLKLALGPGVPMEYAGYGTLSLWFQEYVKGDVIFILEACSSGCAISKVTSYALCRPGYYVITSTKSSESCWSHNGNVNYFIEWLCEGVNKGTADADKDGVITVGELGAYVWRRGVNTPINGDGITVYQFAQTWPEGNDFPMIRTD